MFTYVPYTLQEYMVSDGNQLEYGDFFAILFIHILDDQNHVSIFGQVKDRNLWIFDGESFHS